MEQKAATVGRKKLISKLHGDRIIWLVILLLALISIIAVYSSSSSLAYKAGTSTFSFLLKQMTFVILGFIALLVCYRIPLGIYRKFSIVLFIFSGLLMVYTMFKGANLNEASRWIKIGSLTFQPSELAKIAVVLYLARILETSKLDTFKDYSLKILLPIGAMCALCLYGSVSVALIICSITLIILLCAGVKMKYIGATVGIAIAGIAIIFTIHVFVPKFFSRLDTFTARIERFFVPESKIKEMTEEELAELKRKSYQEEQAVEAIQLGGLLGRGPGKSIKSQSLPHPYSDFIYASIIEEWGLLVGGLVVIMLYLWFFYRCIIIARSCTKVFSTIVVLGLSLLITMQAFLHILVNVGILPVTGQTLPLISLGGTSYIIMSCAFGIILSVNRTIEIKVEQSAEMETIQPTAVPQES